MAPPPKRRSALGLIATVVMIVVGAFVAARALLRDLKISATADLVLEAVALGVSAGVALWFVVVAPLRADAAAERERTLQRERALTEEATRQEFDSRVHRALDMAATEAGTYRITTRILAYALPRLSAELLMADSSNAHLKRSAATGADGAGPGCEVASPHECPAIRRAQTLTFASATEIDTCPYLVDRPGGDRSAVCVPVSVAGRAIGVLHAVAAPETAPSEKEIDQLNTLATNAGRQIGALRVMEATFLQAATDPLTGLLNRRSFENRVQELLHRDAPLAMAMADLDHFKLLNDTHGHDAGDRALRLFGRTLRTAMRSEDLVCRYGGEEFVIALPGLNANDAARVLSRVQENLALALTAGSVPAFTASFGVTDGYPAASIEDLVRSADGALFRAKRAGRNRIVVDGAEPPTAPRPEPAETSEARQPHADPQPDPAPSTT